MYRFATPLLILISLTGMLPGCSSDEPTRREADDASTTKISKSFGTGPVKLTVELSARNVTTADALVMRVVLDVPQGYEAEFPDLLFPEDMPGTVLTGYDDSETTAGDKRQFVREYELEPQYEGTLTVPKMEVYYHESEAVEEHVLESEPLEVTVSETPASAETLAFKPMRGLLTVEQIEARRKRIWPWIAACIVAAVLAFCLLVWYVRRPKPEPPPRPAHEVAIERLHKLTARKLVEQGLIEPFFVEITAIVRDYIEQAFDLRAPEQTTEEFLATIPSAPAVARHEAILKPFLIAADEVKFARAQPEPAVIQRTFDTARDFILQTSDVKGGTP